MFLRTPTDAKFIYVKLGWIAKLTTLGPTVFYGEYGLFEDFVSVGFDPNSIDPTAGAAVRVTGNEAEVWGIGVAQTIEAAAMQLYVGYRHHEADFDLVDGGGAAVAHIWLEEFDTVVTGGIIAF